MSELATQNGSNLPANGVADYYTQFGEQASMRNIVGKLLKFSKGDYMAGENNDDIAEGTELVVNMETLTTGWIKWQDNKPAEQLMGLVCEGFAPANRKALDEQDQSMWEIDESTNQPRDPWQFTIQVVMKVPGDSDAELYTFSTSSRGGVNAMGDLSKVYGKHARAAPDDMPIIALNVGSYMHSNKAFGKIKFPIFEVKSWTSKLEFAEAQGSLALAKEEASKPATKF